MTDNTDVRMDETRRNVGKCPSCRGYLWADVWIKTTTSEPGWLDRMDAPSARAYSKAVATSLSHECRDMDETEGLILGEPLADWERELLNGDAS